MALKAKYLAADGAIGCFLFFGVSLYGAAADCSVKVYHGDAAGDIATGNLIAEVHLDVSVEGSTTSKAIMLPEPIIVNDGIYVDLTGVGATCIAYYK